LAQGEGVIFEHLGVALVRADPDQMRALADEARSGCMQVEAERSLRASGSHAAARRSSSVVARPGSMPAPRYTDSRHASWGLQATRVPSSPYSAQGVRVAVLDTGLDLRHPDFRQRSITARAFISERDAGDLNGHGTFSAGIACGPQSPEHSPRYGIAYAAELFIGKVLDEFAEGTDGNVLAGINWAVREGCAVVLMAFGTPVFPGESYSQLYEEVAARALAAGTLLIAPAGSQSQRPDSIAPVEQPANCPSILAVAALDQTLRVTPSSNGAVNPAGGEVDLAAPGVAVTSAGLRPNLHETAGGSSAAAAHVAGIAALFAEARRDARGASLRRLLLDRAVALPAPARDVGAGLVQAPG
jgi:subtilisin family serine protease